MLSDIPKEKANLKCYQGNTFDINYIINTINRVRKDNGLPELTQDQRLNESSKSKADDMVNRNYWSHVDPDGKMSWDLIKNAGYKFKDAGENMAKDFDNVNSVEKWLDSQKHLNNILDKKFKNVGLGESGNFKVMHFGLEKK